jgi:hypothetical protein
MCQHIYCQTQHETVFTNVNNKDKPGTCSTLINYFYPQNMPTKSPLFLDNHIWNQYKHEYVIAAKKALVYGSKTNVYNAAQIMAGLAVGAVIYIHGSEWAKQINLSSV